MPLVSDPPATPTSVTPEGTPADHQPSLSTRASSRGGRFLKQQYRDSKDDAARDTTSSTVAICGHDEDETPKLSKKRWLILFAVCVVGLSQTLAGDTGPVFNLLLELLELEVDQFLYIGQIFHYVMLLLMVPTTMFANRFGIRTNIHAAASVFVMDGLLRSLLYLTQLPGWSRYKMLYYFSCCILGVERYALYILLPLKVSESWFSKSERSVVWTIMMSQSEVGFFITSTVYPRIVESVADFRLLAYVNLAVISVTAITCVACVTRSEPETPPNKRVAEAARSDSTPFLVTIKRMLTHKDIMLHQLHSAVSASVSLTVGSVLPDIFKSIGFSPIFTGNYLAVNALISIVMLIVMASFVHKVQNATLACKLCSIARSSLFIGLIASIMLKAPGHVIIIASIAATVCKSWSSPHFNNMNAHLACGTVSQPTIVGFSVLATTLTYSLVQVTFATLIEKQPDKSSDYYRSLLFLVVVCAIDELIYLILFRGRQVQVPNREDTTEESTHQNEVNTEDGRSTSTMQAERLTN